MNEINFAGGSANKDDSDDVVRVFTFFDKTKVELFGYYTHKNNGNPGTAGDFIYSFALDAADDDAYAENTEAYSRGGEATRGAQELFIDSNSSLEDTKDNIDKGVTTNFLDLDESGSYVASQDGLFLYLYTQTAKPLADSALELFIDSNSSLEDTKGSIAKFLP